MCDSTTDVCHTTGSPVRRCATPTHPDHAHHDSMADCSLSSLLGTSFLTPTKMAAMNDISLDAISFSPLYNFVTPQRGGTPPPRSTVMSSKSGNHGNTITPNSKHHPGNRLTTPLPSDPATSSNTSSVPSATCPVPVPVSDHDTTPSHSHSNTGTGIPELDSGVFSPFSSSLRFSTPLGLQSVSPLIDLPGNVFSTPQSTERTDITSHSPADTYSEATRPKKSGSRQLFPFHISTPPS